MSRNTVSILLTTVLTFTFLGGCSEDPTKEETVPGGEIAKKLDQAAEQSRPGAKEVLEQAADEAATHERLPPADKPGSFVQKAMEDAADEPETSGSVHR